MVADLDRRVRLDVLKRTYGWIGFIGLFALLAGFTLTTMDGGDLAPLIFSGLTLLLLAVSLVFPFGKANVTSVPAICLLLMASYGVIRTAWLPQKIVYDGWQRVLFWLTAAGIVLVSMQIFRNGEMTARFRRYFVFFGSAVCVLDLLEQASYTNRFYWFIQSRYATVNGPFAYWNNFAQLVELCLPITLWLGVSGRRLETGYLLLSGLQIGAVVASGSRAGSVMVIVELIAVLVISFLGNRNRTFLYAAISALLVSLLFVYAAGFDKLSQKLQQRDQLAVRRDINRSSLEMIRERPLTGWGLGTYVPVYRMFAHYDDGTYVNRAHNDWLEWTAEGGVFFSGLMLVTCLWSIRRAMRSVWGIGVIAICLHALVDYPFARLGVCGWYFALLGMLAVAQSEGGSALEHFRRRTAWRTSQRKTIPSPA